MDIVGKILETNMTYTVVQQGPDPANHLLSGLEKNMPWWPKSAGSITKREGSWMLPPRAQDKYDATCPLLNSVALIIIMEGNWGLDYSLPRN